MKNRDEKQLLGSMTAKGGFINEHDVVTLKIQEEFF